MVKRLEATVGALCKKIFWALQDELARSNGRIHLPIILLRKTAKREHEVGKHLLHQ